MGKNRKKNKAELRSPHNKDTLIQVGFNDADAKVLNDLVEIELPVRIKTEPKFGRATLIREAAMPSLRQRLLDYQGGANNAERRVADGDRRHTEPLFPVH